MPVYTGTIDEQWAEAGIDLALGRITGAELHELGTQILLKRRAERDHEIDKLTRDLNAADDELRSVEGERDDAERAQCRAERELEEMSDERDELKEQIAELERTIRGLQQEKLA